jgi:hypothetical protein
VPLVRTTCRTTLCASRRHDQIVPLGGMTGSLARLAVDPCSEILATMVKRRFRLLLSTAVLTLVVAAAALVLVRHQRTLAERRNPSFKYGQQVLEAIYGNLGGAITLACRSAIDSPPPNAKPPINLDQAKALDGCRFQEQIIDN